MRFAIACLMLSSAIVLTGVETGVLTVHLPSSGSVFGPVDYTGMTAVVVEQSGQLTADQEITLHSLAGVTETKSMHFRRYDADQPGGERYAALAGIEPPFIAIVEGFGGDNPRIVTSADLPGDETALRQFFEE